MNGARVGGALAVSALLVASGTARADVKKQERSLVKFEGLLGGVVNLFGGKAAKEGIVNTVAVKGDRKLTVNDQTGEIVDLKEEKLYRLDMRNKTYEVLTFADLRREMEEARRKAQEAPRGGEPSGDGGRGSSGSQAKESPAPQKQVEVDFNIKETGQRRTINGFDTREAVMTIALREKGKTLEQSGGLVLTSDMWLGPRVAAENDAAAFDLRYARKLAGPTAVAAAQAQMAMAMATYPGMGDAFTRFQSESAKLDGTPILMTTTLEAVKSPAQMAQQQEQAQAEDEKPKGLGGLLGRKIGKKIGGGDKGEAKPRSTIMTITNEVLSLSPTVAAADVALPAGFRQK